MCDPQTTHKRATYYHVHTKDTKAHARGARVPYQRYKKSRWSVLTWSHLRPRTSRAVAEARTCTRPGTLASARRMTVEAENTRNLQTK